MMYLSGLYWLVRGWTKLFQLHKRPVNRAKQSEMSLAWSDWILFSGPVG
jgi:hypothetical protein